MTQMVDRRHGVTVLAVPEDGPALTKAADFLDLVGDAMGNEADMVTVPVGRLTDEFFRLRSGLAGEVVQKFVNYRVRLTVVGDLSRRTADGSALSAFVAESNRGRQLWFVPDEAALDDRLSRASKP
ncbi:MAG: DUF4180 domain-containing protein [Stackebrandtia sp.]